MKVSKYLIFMVIISGIFMIFTGCGQEPAVYELKDGVSAIGSTEQEEREEREGKDTAENGSDVSESGSPGIKGEEDSEAGAVSEPRMFYVYICGSVTNPGVYALPEGSRVYELIEAAGGLLEDADERSLNQAGMLEDGMQITVYNKEEAAEMPVQTSRTGQESPDSGKVNLNTADVDRLTTLSGIGEARAKAIIAYREQHGGFQNIEDIMKIEGIKEKLFEKIKEQIEV
ncbi:MAG TPA: helix-hairpin-helix domain-containing protein [Candidatus Pelethocola excrementipullorum]|nr:helix-hairpin-helix domain-containing protein [Candidatus Pelethocola excrementipullorum]